MGEPRAVAKVEEGKEGGRNHMIEDIGINIKWESAEENERDRRCGGNQGRRTDVLGQVTQFDGLERPSPARLLVLN